LTYLLNGMSLDYTPAKHPPQKRVVNPQPLGGRKNRHLTHQQYRMVFKEMCETAPRTCPGNLYRLHTITIPDPRNLRMEHTTELEEVRMTPLALYRVVNPQLIEPTRPLKVDVEVQSVLSQLNSTDPPRP
jgi:hypothetical protein